MRTGKTIPPVISVCPIVFVVASLLLAACQPVQPPSIDLPAISASPHTPTPLFSSTPYPTRPLYAPGELVDYVAQTGDSLAVLAIHFNTTVKEILSANSFIPANATTLPPGMPMKIPIYYLPFWGTPYQILPDSLFVNGPAQVEFNTASFVATTFGWLNGYREYASDANRSGAQIVDLVATNFSVSPRLLLALLEYQSGALSQSKLDNAEYPLGYEDYAHKGLYLQLVWAANKLNNGYYGWRTGRSATLELQGNRLERPDPWQNAATVAIQLYFSQLLSPDAYTNAISPQGIALTYRDRFGDPWQADQPHIPGSLTQPDFSLPFTGNHPWTLTGGPHTGWGDGDPLAAIDLAPPGVKGCGTSTDVSTAVASGVVARSEPAIVVLDLDSQDQPADGDERTGWVVFYLHMRTDGRVADGTRLNTGDPVGYPSCEGGEATGTHIHIARKYNGEWMPADSAVPFNLKGWIAHNGAEPYLGSLTRFSQTITACTCSDQNSQIGAEPTSIPGP
jgi:LysM repeat protein